VIFEPFDLRLAVCAVKDAAICELTTFVRNCFGGLNLEKFKKEETSFRT
jgi:hypothetical protein